MRLRLRILTIAVLLSAIFVTCLSGTLSNYTSSSSFEIEIAPKIKSILIPNIDALDQSYVINGLYISNRHTDITKEKNYVVFTGDIIQNSRNGGLVFGTHPVGKDFYLLYFKPGTVIRFKDGISIPMSGFYTIAAGSEAVDLFDKTLYEQTESGYVLKKDGTSFKICTDFITICDELGIPLK